MYFSCKHNVVPEGLPGPPFIALHFPDFILFLSMPLAVMFLFGSLRIILGSMVLECRRSLLRGTCRFAMAFERVDAMELGLHITSPQLFVNCLGVLEITVTAVRRIGQSLECHHLVVLFRGDTPFSNFNQAVSNPVGREKRT